MLISYTFLFPIIILAMILEFVVPSKVRPILLLALSLALYYMSGTKAIYVLPVACIISYGGAILLSKADSPVNKKVILAVSIALLVGLLIVFKYKVGGVVAPIGLSFFILEAIAYVSDCYNGKLEAEKNPLYVFLHISFFPTLSSGPIERGKNLIPQFKRLESISRKELFDISRICDSAILIIYGLFVKYVIADRIKILVDTVYDGYFKFGTVELVLAAAFFFIQLYCDFMAYSNVALGVAGLFGIKIMQNFKAPFLAISVSEYWDRWHISLSSWLRDYIYIPLGGNRKGKIRKYINLMITFIVSGLWHGNGFSFIIWGGLNGLYLVIENILTDIGLLKKRKKDQLLPFGPRTLRAFCSFVLVAFTFIFFRADSTTIALKFIKQMFTCPNFWRLSDVNSYFSLGLDVQEVFILCIALLILAGIDFVQYKRNFRVDQWLQVQGPVFRVIFVMAILLCTMVFGIYGSGVDQSAFYYQSF